VRAGGVPIRGHGGACQRAWRDADGVAGSLAGPHFLGLLMTCLGQGSSRGGDPELFRSGPASHLGRLPAVSRRPSQDADAVAVRCRHQPGATSGGLPGGLQPALRRPLPGAAGLGLKRGLVRGPRGASPATSLARAGEHVGGGEPRLVADAAACTAAGPSMETSGGLDVPRATARPTWEETGAGASLGGGDALPGDGVVELGGARLGASALGSPSQAPDTNSSGLACSDLGRWSAPRSCAPRRPSQHGPPWHNVPRGTP
jgi:hypothetical protein